MPDRPKIGDWVEIKSKEEILSTLDENGCIDGMPFMPEMLQFCGKRFRVYKSAHKTCDYSGPEIRSRWLENTIHLETRCDGSAHDGCQAGCLLYWNTAWLKPVSGPSSDSTYSAAPALHNTQTASMKCSEADLWKKTTLPQVDNGPPTYFCQTTEIPAATKDLEWWDIRQYLKDYTSGNVTFGRLVRSLIYSAYYNLSQAGIGVGAPMRWFYDKIRFLWGGSMWPRKPGVIPAGSPTPTVSLNLQPGELVRVKSQEQILQTVTTDNLNRGMHWDAELVPYCGGTYRVLKRVHKIIHEKTGKMTDMKTACIILDQVVCQARYSACRMQCPKAMYPYWREIWLERVSAPVQIKDVSTLDSSKAETGAMHARAAQEPSLRGAGN